MAVLIPSLGYARFDTRGELRLAERLKDFLEENAVVWHNLPVGPRNRHPDFIIVHPANGLLVLEVKDWRLESIASWANPSFRSASGPCSRTSRAGNSIRPISRKCSPSTCVCSRMK